MAEVSSPIAREAWPVFATLAGCLIMAQLLWPAPSPVIHWPIAMAAVLGIAAVGLLVPMSGLSLGRKRRTSDRDHQRFPAPTDVADEGATVPGGLDERMRLDSQIRVTISALQCLADTLQTAKRLDSDQRVSLRSIRCIGEQLLRVADQALEQAHDVVESPSVDRGRSEPARRHSPSQPFLSGRVLLVEDSPVNRQLVACLLEQVGLEVRLAENGQSGIDEIRAAEADQRRFDLVLMDLDMPVLSGYAATHRLHRAGFEVPIVALAAPDVIVEDEGQLRSTFHDVITKPIDRRQLWAAVDRVLTPAKLEPALR